MQIPLSEIKTPLTDKILKIYTFKTKEGIILNETITHGQKIIIECILGRKAPIDIETIKRIHTMAHTRYGKSIAIAIGVSVRSSTKHEPWAVVAGTKDQAQIIMDYVIQFSVNDPMLRGQLVNEKEIRIERLTQRRKRDHLTYKFGGEVRAYGAGKDGTAVMGQGCANVIEDESALINDTTQSKIFRMLGDHMDNFYMKVGNPFNNNHFKRAFSDVGYFKINIDYKQGMIDGRLTEAFVEEVRKNPNFDILYANIFPDVEDYDEKGYLPLFTHRLVEMAQIERDKIAPWGAPRLGCDPADSGKCESNIVRKFENVAEVLFGKSGIDPITFAGEVAVRSYDVQNAFIDRVGVGSGTYHLLTQQMTTKKKTVGFNGAEKLPSSILQHERELYLNMRAYVYWQSKLWLELGNKLIRDDRWSQLLAVKYKTTKGKIQIISKEELGKEPYNISDIGVADCLSMTFTPVKRMFNMPSVKGGIKSRF
ncbi:MAG: hypothetical protein UR99_C0017G0034 [Candidatus Moranbacteria bacterium GW2011_GWD2_36_12]|nr:MAG: hypothetical protein UR99_C0017G0034 [Candidatus Moranbacteria bacterium GW2011_GWD2_36_12]